VLQFQNLTFSTRENVIKLQKAARFSDIDSGFVEIQVAGENKDTSEKASNLFSLKHLAQYLWKS